MKKKFNDNDIQRLIGSVLRYGVWVALSVTLLGGLLLLIQDSGQVVEYNNFVGKEKNILHVMSDIFSGTRSLRGESIVFLGILLLFVTPVLRILLSLVSFLIEKDYLYVCITSLVILIIAISISFGFSH